MTRRRKLILGIALVGAAALVWAVPACRYRILGVVKREPFYQGMPASYWRDRFVQFETDYARKKREWEAPLPRPPSLEWLRDSLEEKFPAIASPALELPQLHDPEAIPVLIVLLLDEDPLVSSRGCFALAMMGEPAVPALVKLLQDSNPKVRLRAVTGLSELFSPGLSQQAKDAAIPAIRELSKDADKRVALDAIEVLAGIDASFRDTAVSAVIRLLRQEDRGVRFEAINVLGNLSIGGLGEQAQHAAVCAIREATSDSDKGVAERARVVLEAIVRPARSQHFSIGLVAGCVGQEARERHSPAKGSEPEGPAPMEAVRGKILEAVIRDLLTTKEHREWIEAYGVQGAKEYALASNSQIPWPPDFAPPIPGYDIRLLQAEDEPLDPERPALACIWLQEFKFDPDREKWDESPMGGPIEILVNTTRGSRGGGAIGGCTIWYDYRRNAGKWEVVFAGALDP